MHRREMLVGGLALAGACLLSGAASAAHIPTVPTMDAQAGYTWVVLGAPPSGKARQFIRRHATARLARTHGTCPTFLFSEADAATLEGLL